MVLDGMAAAIDKAVGIRYWKNQHGLPRKAVGSNPHRVQFIRYADDWIVTATNPEILENQVKPAIKEFLAERGLELSKHKTITTSIHKGFDFLGQNLRKYNGKLLIKPSKKSVKKLLTKIRQTIKLMCTAPAYTLISRLNEITKGWTMYHRHCAAKQTFSWIDHHIWTAIWRWCVRRHRNKPKKWIVRRYFTQVKGDKWVFSGKHEQKTYHLHKLSWVKVVRYIKIKASINPFVKEDEPYLEKHLQRKMLNTWQKRKRLIVIFRRQDGKCPMCKQLITKQTGWHIHHKLERYKGGKDTLDNLVMLHPICHQQVHFWHIQFDGDVPIRASESA